MSRIFEPFAIIDVDPDKLGVRRRLPRQGTSLEVYGTIAFDEEWIAQRIGFGTPTWDELGGFLGYRGDKTVLSVDLWILSVPEVYREQAARCVVLAAERLLHGGRPKATPYMLRRFARFLHEEIFTELEPVGRPDVY